MLGPPSPPCQLRSGLGLAGGDTGSEARGRISRVQPPPPHIQDSPTSRVTSIELADPSPLQLGDREGDIERLRWGALRVN